MADIENYSASWKPRYNPWIIALTVTLATFMKVLDTSIANPTSAAVALAGWKLPLLEGVFSSCFGKPCQRCDTECIQPRRRDGETGRRSGLKIRRPSGHGGSSPPPGTNSTSVPSTQNHFSREKLKRFSSVNGLLEVSWCCDVFS